MKLYKLGLSYGVVLAALIGASSALAAEMEEITVTATKRPQSIQDVGIAVAAFDGETMRDLGIKSAKDITEITAGVLYSGEYGNAPSFSIRGVNVNDFNVTTNPSAAVYVDGVYKQSNANSGAALFDLERIEILKGPQGTLWGRNTTAGAVNILTKAPTDEFEAYVDAGFGQHGYVDIEGAISGSLSDGIRGRLSLQSITSDGSFNNRATGPGVHAITDVDLFGTNKAGVPDSDPGDQDLFSVRGQLAFDPSDSTELRLIGFYTRDKGENHVATIMGTAGVDCPITFSDPSTHLGDPVPIGGRYDPALCSPPLGGDIDDEIYDENVSVDYVPEKDNEIWGVSATLDWEEDQHRIVSITAIEGMDRFEGVEFGYTGLGLNLAYQQELRQLSQELRYEYTGDGLWYTIGGGFSHDTINGLQGGSVTAFGGALSWETKNTNTTAAIFGQAEFDLSEELTLVTGLRFGYIKSAMDKYVLYATAADGSGGVLDTGSGLTDIWGYPAAAIVSSAAGTSDPLERSSQDTDYRIGLNWSVSSDLLLYVAHARGTKNGGYDSNIITDSAAIGAYDEEVLKSIETGFKWDANEQIRVNGTVFYYDYQRPQYRTSVFVDGNPVSKIDNLDEVESQGAELEVTWLPHDNWDFRWNLALLDTEISDAGPLIDGGPEVPNGLLDGNYQAFSPKVSSSLMVNYNQPLNADLVMRAVASANYVGDHYPTPENSSFEEQQYTLVNARIGVSSEKGEWDVSVWGRNLLDERYANYAFNHFGARSYFISDGRIYGINLKKSF